MSGQYSHRSATITSKVWGAALYTWPFPAAPEFGRYITFSNPSFDIVGNCRAFEKGEQATAPKGEACRSNNPLWRIGALHAVWHGYSASRNSKVSAHPKLCYQCKNISQSGNPD